MLSTVVFVQGNKVISPYLVTAREYGRWLETVYDSYTCERELYLRESVGENIVLSRHPGTKIGRYFDTHEFFDNKYSSWYVHYDSTIMKKLASMGLAKNLDVPQVMGGSRKGQRLLRLYSLDQIRVYLQAEVDRNFTLEGKVRSPKKITLRKQDLVNVEIPQCVKHKKSLLDGKSINMTVAEIEEKLGHKVSIIS